MIYAPFDKLYTMHQTGPRQSAGMASCHLLS